jgi:intracellular sulfur oxidation DsrE/DsrF family protein
MYGVVFNACEQTMKTIHIDKADLISQAVPVFSGAVDLITLQQKGYAYIAW